MSSREGLIRKMQGGIGIAEDLRLRGDSEGAREVLEQVAADADRAGIRSSQLFRHLAAVCDGTGDMTAAMGYIHRAFDEDPLSPEVMNSYGILLARLQTSLADPNRPPDDPSTPELYRVLVREERATVAPHIAMVRWFVAADQMEEAVELTRAITHLFPGSVESWRLLAKLASAIGDKSTAREAKARAAKAQAAENREQPAPRATQSKAKA